MEMFELRVLRTTYHGTRFQKAHSTSMVFLDYQRFLDYRKCKFFEETFILQSETKETTASRDGDRRHRWNAILVI